MKYLYQLKEWPEFTWNETLISNMLAQVRHRQGRVLGRMDGLGFRFKAEAVLQTLTEDVLKSSEIEGEKLNADQVRSSIARKLGMEIAGLVAADRNVEGVVEMMLDATQRYKGLLTKDRLFGWHSSLFPSGTSGLYKIDVGKWRSSDKGPMQVVSGPMGKEKIHFQAPEAGVLNKEMSLFLKWFNSEIKSGSYRIDPVLKSAIAHLWFVTIHPFDDGNGRIARAIADMQLARSDGSSQRFYSMSAQIRKERKDYYEILEKTQRGNPDITAWMQWYLNCLDKAITGSEKSLSDVLSKAKFWERYADVPINDRQKIMINKLLDARPPAHAGMDGNDASGQGFAGKLNSTKWGKIAKCSHDTALRDIRDLLEKSILIKEPGGSKNTSYILNLENS